MMLMAHYFFQDCLKTFFKYHLNSIKRNQANNIVYITTHTLKHSYPIQSIIIFFHFKEAQEKQEQKK